MELAVLLAPQLWAQATFGKVKLGDQRRTKRLVKLAGQMALAPAESLPRQTQGNWGDLKAAYRLLHEEDVTVEQVLAPHVEQTRQDSTRQQGVTLLVQDLSELDYGRHPAIQGLGPVGNGSHQGLLLQSVLAIDPQTRQVRGLSALEVFKRVPRPKHETRKQRLSRPRETDAWLRLVRACGRPEPGAQWVHVGDAGADMFRLMWTCRQMGCDYVIRSGHDRLVSTQDQQASDKLYAYVSRQPLLGQRVLHLDSTPTQRERAAQVELRLCHLWLTPSSDERVEMLSQDAHGQLQALETWVIQVKEVHPPTKGAVERHPPAGAEQELIEPLEWVLLTSVPTQTAAQAWQRVQWYTCRWIVEEYHHGLKTGCRLEDRKVRDAAALQRLIAILAPMALRLLQVRWWARTAPAQPALDCLPAQPVEVMARVLQCPPASITAGQFWRQVAQWGGYLGRTSDGPPGWKTLWKGWFHLQTLLDGFQLASSPPP